MASGARSRSGLLSHAHPRRRRPQHLPVAVCGCVGGCADPDQSTNFVLSPSFGDEGEKRRYHRRMAMTTNDCGSARPSPNLSPAAALFHGLADPTRLAILQRLADGEARVVDLTGLLSMAQSTVSAHLACLRDCGLVVGRPEGRQMFYSLTRPELLDLLATAETLLAATGNAVALCPNYGTRSRTGATIDAEETGR